MNTLYIIGNGFDRKHDLPTQFEDFHKYVMENRKELERDFEEYFRLGKSEEHLWTNFEKDLETFDWKSFYHAHCNIDINEDSFKPSLFYSLEDDLKEQTDRLTDSIREAFESWIENIDIESVNCILTIEDNSFFITFNYTLLLERVYKIPNDRILHIHGDIEYQQNDKLIFGHNSILEEEPELDENGDSNRTISSGSESASKYPFYALQKPVKEIIEENKKQFECLSTIKKVIVLGHSLNKIDIPYFKEIIGNTNDVKYEVSYHTDWEKENHPLTLQGIGIDKNNIKMIIFNDLIW